MEVRLEQVQFSLGNRPILSIPALTFAHGSTTALFGPNGSGKTTLLRLIAGLELPTAGAISPVQVSFAFQRPVFIRGTVQANLDLGLLLRRLPVGERQARILEAAREFGIEGLLDRSAHALSAGEAQRVNLARALCLRAPVTLLDEPLASLDRIGRGRMLEELPHLLQTFATTTIIVTHDREEAFRLADYLVVLVEGRVRAQGPSGAVYRAPLDRLTAELLGYMIVQSGNRTMAVPPGGLVLGPAEEVFDMTVLRVVDMGNHRDALGQLNGASVTVRVPDGYPPINPGQRVQVAIRSAIPLRDPV
jgi:ABC-type sugar transport system ATPase subunit